MASFDDLAANRAGPALVRQLASIYRSRQKAMLRAVLDRANRQKRTLGPLPAPNEAWRLLVLAEANNRRATEAVVYSPQLSLWAARVLCRLRTGADDAEPFWVDLGSLHAAAAAAVKTLVHGSLVQLRPRRIGETCYSDHDNRPVFGHDASAPRDIRRPGRSGPLQLPTAG